ncbi:MAG: hypothetical protein FWG75_04445 [Cystobacterineae bacterium]|nr:hypothetical protein [Cystobacterineae bacterium]
MAASFVGNDETLVNGKPNIPNPQQGREALGDFNEAGNGPGKIPSGETKYLPKEVFLELIFWGKRF